MMVLKAIETHSITMKNLALFKANFQSVEFSERAEILLFTRENVALK